MSQYLYLKIVRRATTLLLLTCAVPMLGQYSSARRSEPRNTTRAVAVFEVDTHGLGRLYPVMLMLEGKIYDASLYGSRPVPMALWGDTVYEVQKSGMPTGLLTLDLARRLQTQWWGEGKWKPFATDEKKDTKNNNAKPGEKKADAKPTLKDDRDDERPTLKKPKPDAVPAATTETSKPEQKPTTSGSESTKTETKASTAAGGKTEQKPEPTKSRNESGPDDPDRPVLRRGMPVGTSQVKEQPFEDVTPAKAKDLNVARGPVQAFVAVSDATPGDNRPFDMHLGPEEQEKYGKELARQAWEELKKYAGASATIPPEPAFANVSIRAFDLDYSNNPVLVYTAEYKSGSAPVPVAKSTGGGKKSKDTQQPVQMPSGPPKTYYVTWVGKVDLQGAINRMFASATDSKHLDATPRLEMIDVVDADGDNRAELLFRQISDIGRDYVIYRGSPYWGKMFEGAGAL